MRVECEACRELVVASFAVEGGAVRAHCPVCQHVTSTSLAAPAEAPSESEPCPKCGAPRKPEAMACAACGLAVARMSAYVAARDGAVPDSLREAWQRATDGWSDEAKHDELLRLVAAHDAYAWAAGRYRTRKDAMATRQLERLRRAAEATLLAGATARQVADAKPYRASSAVLAMLVVAVVAGLLYALVVRSPGAHTPTPTAPAPVRPLTPGHPVSPSTSLAPPGSQ